MTKTQIAKTTIGLAVQMGAGKIVHSIIRNNVAPENALDQITLFAGSYAIGGMVAEQARAYSDRAVDQVVDAFQQIRD